MKRTVDVISNAPLHVLKPVMSGEFQNIKLSNGEIRACILQGAKVYETINGKKIKLTLKNYLNIHEAKKLADEKKAKEEAEAAKKLADEKKAKEEAEAAKKLADEKKAKEEAEAKKLADEKKAKEEAEAAKKLADEKKAKKTNKK